MSLFDDQCDDVNSMQSRDSSPRSGPWLLLNPSQNEIGCCARRFHPLFLGGRCRAGPLNFLEKKKKAFGLLARVRPKKRQKMDVSEPFASFKEIRPSVCNFV